MDIERAVVNLGVQATRYYRERPGIANETAISETDLSRFIAEELRSQRRIDARAEMHYLDCIFDPAVRAASVGEFGNNRTDIAIYRDQRYFALIELKIVDEGRRSDGVLKDASKIRRIQQLCSGYDLKGYVGGLVCDVCRGTNEVASDGAIDELVNMLRLSSSQRSDKVLANSGGWYWQFFCGRLDS